MYSSVAIDANGDFAVTWSNKNQSNGTWDVYARVFSANGNTNGIVWAFEDVFPSAILHAYDATNLSNALYNTSQAGQLPPGPPVKFVAPTIANGKVYAATATQLAVFTVTQIAALTTTQITGLTGDQLAALSDTQLLALTATELGALTTAQAAQLSAAQLAELTTAQIQGLTSTGLGTLTLTP